MKAQANRCCRRRQRTHTRHARKGPAESPRLRAAENRRWSYSKVAADPMRSLPKEDQTPDLPLLEQPRASGCLWRGRPVSPLEGRCAKAGFEPAPKRLTVVRSNQTELLREVWEDSNLQSQNLNLLPYPLATNVPAHHGPGIRGWQRRPHRRKHSSTIR